MLNHLLYIDPGTGSLFYQAILSAILTVSIFGNKIKLYLKSIIHRTRNKEGKG
ncbi:hypothetical protein B0O44_10216 [Pedobacter nutrimenti]|uniref:Uncharacterized protein n=1 Tax=Pedobacter nutrimenti TaxID=1241337 RepID=A0A318UJI1_9SPHI|nr:hypothetical protein B0O44_10216 [Pedobacter nutrimenti]